MVEQADIGTQMNLTYNILVLNHINLMFYDRAAGRASYWIRFCQCLKLIINHIDTKIVLKIEAEKKLLDEEVAHIKTTDDNDVSKEKRIREVQEKFADEHEVIITRALSRIGIVFVAEDGAIDVKDFEPEALRNLIVKNSEDMKRDGSNVPDKLKHESKSILGQTLDAEINKSREYEVKKNAIIGQGANTNVSDRLRDG